MKQGSKGNKAKKNQGPKDGSPPSAKGNSQKNAPQDQPKKSKSKTSNQAAATAPLAEPAASVERSTENSGSQVSEEPTEAALEPKRKVAKTLLFSPAAVVEAAAAASSEPPAPPIAERESTPEERIAEQRAAVKNTLGEKAAEESIEEEKPKRKVAKTIIFDTTSLKAAVEAAEKQQAAPSLPVPETTLELEPVLQEHSEPSALAVSDENVIAEEVASAEPAKRKVAKTLLFDPAKIVEAASSAQDQPKSTDKTESTLGQTEPVAVDDVSGLAASGQQTTSASDPENPKRKVAKTLLFDISNVSQIAVVADQTQPDTTAAAEPEVVSPEIAETPKRKVPKTILYDTAKIADAVQAAADQAIETAGEMPQSVPLRTGKLHAASSAAYDDPAPELNIDSPPVRLFFEEPLPEDSAPAAQASDLEAPPAADVAPTPATGAVPTVEQLPSAKPPRRVPRTLLFNPIIGDGGIEIDPYQIESAPSSEAAPSAASDMQDFEFATVTPRRISTKKIAKTLIYRPPTDSGAIQLHVNPSDEADPGAEAPLDEAKAEQYVERYIARTMLDHSILFAQLAITQHKQEEKAIEIAKEKANEPFKPFFPIECNKMALPCNWTWDTSYTTERYRYCGDCQRPVYNFAGLEMADAEEIILKAENRSRFTLYKRTDGNFMTGDCPVAVKKRSDLILMTCGAVLIAFCLVVYMMMLPKIKPKPAPAPVATTVKPSPLHVPAGVARPGTGRYVQGQGLIYDTPPPVPVQQAPAATTSGPDNDEDPQWQFPQGANQPIVDPRSVAPQQPVQQQVTQPAAPTQTTYPAQQSGTQPTQSQYVQTYR